MKLKITNRPIARAILAALSGALGGFVGGFFGAGGGIVLIFALEFLNGAKDGVNEKSSRTRDNFATSLAAITVFSVISVFAYQLCGNLPAKAWTFLPSAAVGGVVGGLLLDKINAKSLRVLFAIIVIYAGINMF